MTKAPKFWILKPKNFDVIDSKKKKLNIWKTPVRLTHLNPRRGTRGEKLMLRCEKMRINQTKFKAKIKNPDEKVLQC